MRVAVWYSQNAPSTIHTQTRPHEAPPAKLTANIWVGDGFVWSNKEATHLLAVWMDGQLTSKEHYNRCMRKTRPAEARLQTLTKIYGAVPESVSAVQMARIQAVMLYGSTLWWDPKTVDGRCDLQLPLNCQAGLILGAPPTTRQGVLITEAGLTSAPVILHSRHQWFTAWLANMSSNKIKGLHKYPSSAEPIYRVVKIEHEDGGTTEGMHWLSPGEGLVVRTITLDNAVAKWAAQCWAREKVAKIGAGVWMWSSDGSRSENGPVEATAVCKHGNQWISSLSDLGSWLFDFFDAELWVIRLALIVTNDKRETLHRHGVKMVAVFSSSQAALRRTAHLEPGPEQWLARWNNQSWLALCMHAIATEIHWVPGPSGIPGNEDADRQSTSAREAKRSTTIEWPYTSASNRARQIS